MWTAWVSPCVWKFANPTALRRIANSTDRIFAEGINGTLQARGRNYGLVLDVGGYYKNVFTLAPSFTITQEEMDLGLELLDQLFQKCIARE